MAPWFPWTDPDGGLELIYAAQDPNASILGVTVMMGVASMEVCQGAAQKVLAAIGRDDIPVLPGARSPEELGVETAAARFIIDTVMANPGQVEVVATGPLTNIATALMLEPDLPLFWKKLHVATGDFRGQLGYESNIYGWSKVGLEADINVDLDVAALRYTLEHGGDFIIYPNEVADDMPLTPDDYAALKRAHTELADFLVYELGPTHAFYNFVGRLAFDGIPTHGVVPLALVLDPSLEVENARGRVELKKRSKNLFGYALSDDAGLPERTILLKLTEESSLKVRSRMLERLSGRP